MTTYYERPDDLKPYRDLDRVPTYVRDRGSRYDLSIDWSDLLTEVGDTLSSVSWSVSGGLTNNGETEASNVATVDLSGTGGEAKCTLTTTGGQVHVRTLRVRAPSAGSRIWDYGCIRR